MSLIKMFLFNKKNQTVKNIFVNFLFFLSFAFLFLSCKTIDQPENVVSSLNYDDQEVVQNEKERIQKLLQEEPVKALWRAGFLNDEDFFEECKQILFQKYEEAISSENINYVDAIRFARTFEVYEINDFSKKISFEELYSKFLNDVPGFNEDSKKFPLTISDCINATATIWVDRGIKIQNGAGYSDIIIGSGFFIDERGYLVTNHHVIESIVNPKDEKYSRLYVKLPSDMDSRIPAKVVGYDSLLDLALLKVEIEPEFILPLGSSGNLNVGDSVSVIGTPVGLEGTLTQGIISSCERKLNTMGYVFQLDAAVNSGNSGGPMIDKNMKVQAIVFAGMLQFQGLNFAIPVEYLRAELPYLYSGGEYLHCWFGSSGKTYRNAGKKSGLEIQYVIPGLSAHFAGLKEGDIITSINNQKINSIEEFQFLSMNFMPGTVVKCSYIRNDENFETFVYFDKREKNPAKIVFERDFVTGSFVPLFGMKMAAASTPSRKLYRIEKIYSGSTAEDLGFSENDQIVLQDVYFNEEAQYFIAQIVTKRRKKGFLDLSMIISCPYDSPNYF